MLRLPAHTDLGHIESHTYYGRLAQSERLAQVDAAERHLFPQVGDQVVVHYGLCWRNGRVIAVHSSWLRNRIPRFEYDIHLENNGVWTAAEMAHFRELFERYDKDKSGFVDLDELRQMLMDLGHAAAFDDEALSDMLRRVDKDGTHDISLDEFCDLVYVEIGGIDHYLYRVPRHRLRIDPPLFRSAHDIFKLHAQPFASLLRERELDRARLRRREAAERLHSLSQPVHHKRRNKMVNFEPRPVMANRSEARRALAR